MTVNYKIRPAQEADAREIHDIYGYYVDHTTVTFNFENPGIPEYAEKIRHVKELYPFYVAEQTDGPDKGKILGFVYGAPLRPHDAYLWDVESTIYLAPDAPKHCGIGTALYQQFIEMLARQGFLYVYGVITETNEASIAMHRKMGFDQAGHFKNMGYKMDQWLGVVWMQKQLAERLPENPERPIPFSEI